MANCITRYLFIELDDNHNASTTCFDSFLEAQTAARKAFSEVVEALFGKSFTIPEECVDAEGYVEYETRDVEISSMDTGWSVWTTEYPCLEFRGSGEIQEIQIPVRPEEIAKPEGNTEDQKNSVFPEWPFEKMVTLHTSHIPEHIFEKMKNDALDPGYALLPFVTHVHENISDPSVIIHCPRDLVEDFPEEDIDTELYKVIRWANDHGAEYIRFDIDGEIIKGLNLYY